MLQKKNLLKKKAPLKKNEFKVIFLNSSHLKLCIDLDRIALNGLWTKEHWAKELLDKNRICLGVIENLKLIAVASGWTIVNEFHLTLIGVHPLYRKKGIGKLVLSMLLSEAKRKGSEIATLEVDQKNSAAIKLYENYGFKTAGIREKYYKNGNDALIKTISLKVSANGISSTVNRSRGNLML